MAIYHCSCKIISRNTGRTSVGASAYRSGTRLYNEFDGQTHDYTKKGGIVYSEVILPPNANKEWNDREKLWNAVERAEKAKNSQLAREYEVALPIECTSAEHIEMVREFINKCLIPEGMCVDFAIHDKKDGNPHAHIMCTMRPLDEKGDWESKFEKVYVCKNRLGEVRNLTAAEMKLPENLDFKKQLPYYKNGNPKSKPVYMTAYEAAEEKNKIYKRVKGKNNPLKVRQDKTNPMIERWNSEEFLIEIRKAVEEIINSSLQKKGLEERVDCRTLEAQGIDRVPTIHLGVAASQLEKRGVLTDKGNENRSIEFLNDSLNDVKKQIAEYENKLQEIKRLIDSVRDYQLITITKRLVLNETSEYFITKIPDERKYLLIPKEDTEWVFNGNSLQAKLYLDKEYKVNDSLLLGRQLSAHYSNAQNYYASIKLSGNLKNAYTQTMPLSMKIGYMKKQSMEDLSQALKVIDLLNRDSVSTFSGLYEKLYGLQERSSDIQAVISKAAESLNKQYEIANALLIYNKYIDIYTESQKKFFGKKAFDNQHKAELQAFNMALETLRSNNIDVNTDVNSVVELIANNAKKLEEIKSQKENVDSKILEYQEAIGYITKKHINRSKTQNKNDPNL